MLTLWTAFFAGIFFWPSAWLVTLEFGYALAVNMLLYAVVVCMSAALVDWRDQDDTPSAQGAEAVHYQSLPFPLRIAYRPVNRAA